MLKPIHVTSTATIAWPDDPAFEPHDDATGDALRADKAAMDPGAWRKLLKLREGERPTLFTMGVIPPGELARIEDEGLTKFRSMAWRCLCRGLMGISDYPPEWGDVEYTTPSGGQPPHVSAAWLDKHLLRDLHSCGIYVGSAIWNWQQLGEADAKK